MMSKKVTKKKSSKKVVKKTTKKVSKKVAKKTVKKVSKKLESIFGGKNVVIDSYTPAEIRRIRGLLKLAGAKSIYKVLKDNTEIIISSYRGFNLFEASKRNIDIYTVGEFDLLNEGRTIIKFPAAKDIPNSQNLSKSPAIKEGETIIAHPKRGVLKIKWKQVPFKVPRRFAELYGMMFIELENPYLGKVYFNDQELKPVKESDQQYDPCFSDGAEIFDYLDYAEDGCDLMGGKTTGDGEFGFNCTAFMEKKWKGGQGMGNRWKTKTYEYTKTNHKNKKGFGVVLDYAETGTLRVNLERKIWQYQHTVIVIIHDGYSFVKRKEPR